MKFSKEGLSKAKNTVLLTLGLVGAGNLKAQPSSGDNLIAKNDKKIEYAGAVSNINSNLEGESPFELWIKGKTKAGETTPTGLNNSFFNNRYGIKPGDLKTIADYYGFRTSTALDFQTDLFTYLEKKHPDVIKELKKVYKLPMAGKFIDGDVGVRTGDAAGFLFTLITPPPKAEIPEPTPEKKTEIAQPDTHYVINVRGDEEQAFFFPQSKEDWEKISSLLPFSSKEEYDAGAKGQTTVNMTKKVMFEVYIKTPEARKILGLLWKRDPKNPNKFIPIYDVGSNTVNYTDFLSSNK